MIVEDNPVSLLRRLVNAAIRLVHLAEEQSPTPGGWDSTQRFAVASATSLPQACQVYVNTSDHPVIFHGRWLQIATPWADAPFVLSNVWIPSILGATFFPYNIAGWPLWHRDEISIVIKPRESVYANQMIFAPSGWLYWRVEVPPK